MGIPNHGQYQLEDIPILVLFNHELFNPGRLTLFLTEVVTWRWVKGWFRPHLVGIGLNHELMNHELFNHDLDFSIPFMLIIEELMVEKSGILSQGRRLGLKRAETGLVEMY